MKKSIYQRAKENGCQWIASCTDIPIDQWEKLMKGHRPANQRKAIKVALAAGVIDSYQAKEELKKPFFNPYLHYYTRTHIIYVHSAIEHFIQIN